jgi:periplasmic protein TonB
MLEDTMVEQATLNHGMFADTLLETSWAHHSRRGWTTLTSFGVQMVALGFLLLIPILSTVGVPPARTTVSTPISLGRPDPGPAPQPHGRQNTGVQIVPFTGRIVAPGRIPTTIPNNDDGAQVGSVGDPSPVGDYVGSGPGLPIPFTGGTHPVMPVAAAPTVRPFRTSSMLQGSLIHRVDPTYPPMARAARIQGTVVLAAVIAKDGTMENLRLISGHPLLVHAAIDAVSQWRYKPYILNDEAIEVETQITVNFVLGGN